MPHLKPVSAKNPPSLTKFDCDFDDGLKKEEALEKLAKLGARLAELQELLSVAGTHSLLIVFQGRDTSGKDGSINRLLEFTNVQSCRVCAFKVPTAEELAHDFLWRVHHQCPGKGSVAIFNRSHYEDVLVVRVHDLAPKEIWKERYHQINEFEATLAAANTIIIKFCLQITKDEQEQRLLEREQDVTKSWKLSVGDWKEREFWDDYTQAYEDVLAKCSTDVAPWYVVPANKKWFRDLAVAETVVNTLENYVDGWMEKLTKIGTAAKAELAEYRKTQ
jgi:PPK2 family polyphosphate:nucleotide phosphotransferase